MIYLECDFKSAGNQHTRCLTLARSTGPLSPSAGFHRYRHDLAFAAIYNEPLRVCALLQVFRKMSQRSAGKEKQKYLRSLLFQDYRELQSEDHPVSSLRPEPTPPLHVSPRREKRPHDCSDSGKYENLKR